MCFLRCLLLPRWRHCWLMGSYLLVILIHLLLSGSLFWHLRGTYLFAFEVSSTYKQNVVLSVPCRVCRAGPRREPHCSNYSLRCMVHLGDIIQTYIAPTIPFGPDPFLPNRLRPGAEFGTVPHRVQNMVPLQSDKTRVVLL